MFPCHETHSQLAGNLFPNRRDWLLALPGDLSWKCELGFLAEDTLFVLRPLCDWSCCLVKLETYKKQDWICSPLKRESHLGWAAPKMGTSKYPNTRVGLRKLGSQKSAGIQAKGCSDPIEYLWMTQHKVTRKERQPGHELQVGLAQQ